jgi:hypothetical protein
MSFWCNSYNARLLWPVYTILSFPLSVRLRCTVTQTSADSSSWKLISWTLQVWRMRICSCHSREADHSFIVFTMGMFGTMGNSSKNIYLNNHYLFFFCFFRSCREKSIVYVYIFLPNLICEIWIHVMGVSNSASARVSHHVHKTSWLYSQCHLFAPPSPPKTSWGEWWGSVCL